MVRCGGCGTTSTGSAWHWIAILRPRPRGPITVCFCPECAESKFRYFSRQRARRLARDVEYDD
jgi:hypothetical protein